jgi:hypothetical protein
MRFVFQQPSQLSEGHMLHAWVGRAACINNVQALDMGVRISAVAAFALLFVVMTKSFISKHMATFDAWMHG